MIQRNTPFGLIILLLCLPQLALALSSQQAYQIGYIIPPVVLVIWLLKRIFFKQVKISKWVPITILSVFAVSLLVTIFMINQDPADVFSEELVKSINEKTPYMVDDAKRLDQASYQKPVISFDITMVNFKPNEISAQQLVDSLYLEEKKGVCESDELKFAFNKGVNLLYNYQDNQGNHITEIEFNAFTCDGYISW